MLAYIFITLVGLVSLSAAGYSLEDDYSTSQFFSMFDFFTDADPTGGYVQYVDQNTAQNGGLISSNGGSVYMGVDHQNVASGSGRQSVRLTSKKSYTHGLIILDLAHMPGSICGIWPAFWTVGPNWPSAGEIDIIEGVNSQRANSFALHTGQGCSISNTGLFSGKVSTPNCDVKASGQPGNAGCAILTSNDESYGDGFNSGQGGVYATEWTSDEINIWFFPRNAIPSDVSSSNPDPSNWGQPTAQFSQGCNIDQFFKDHQIVFDTTFCGDWAGDAGVWSSDAVCSSKAPTCQSFVQNNPSAFQDAYWSVNSLKVYQSNGQQGPASSSVPSQSYPPQGPTASVPWPTPSSGSGAPPLYPSAPTTVQPPAQTSGNAWGGGGWHTRQFGTKNAPSPAATPSASSEDNNDTPAPTRTMGPPVVVTAASDGTVGEGYGGSSSDATITATPTSSPTSNDEGDDTTYSTVSAMNVHEFWHNRFQHRPRDASSEPGLAIEARSAPEEAVTKGSRGHLPSHKRHLFRHAFPGAETDE